MTQSLPMGRAVTVLSIFSGLGGLDLGLEAAGFQSLGCVELDGTARRSLKANRGGEWPLLEPSDVEDLAALIQPSDLGLHARELTLLAGAPPCQPYSKAAMWSPGGWNGLSDLRARPLFAFLELIDRLLPECVLMENVVGFARGVNRASDSIQMALDEINSRRRTRYQLETRVLDAVQFGVPQKRTRAILVATRDGSEFGWPLPTGGRPLRAWDALVNLRDNEEKPSATGKWANLLPSIPEGQNYIWHTDRGEGLPLFGYRTRYWSFLLKLAKGQPSWTLPAQPGPSAGPFHWNNRPLSASEMLRLQSFSSDWVVEGNHREQVIQIGNATPPLLAEILGWSVRRTLRGDSAPDSWVFETPSSRRVPAPEPPQPVPAEYLIHEGKHLAHPGTGRGPRPRSLGAVATTGEA